MIQSLIQSAGKLKFTNQSLVCLMQSDTKINNKQRKSSNPSAVDFVIGIERNGYGQIYLLQGLQKSLHFTVPTSDFQRIVDRPYPSLQTSSKLRQIPHVMVKKSSNHVSSDKRTVVYNAKPDVMMNEKNTSPDQKAIRVCTELVIGMFEDGLSESFSYLERKR